MGQAEEEFMLKLSKSESEKKEYFFALEIDVDRVKSAIWTIEEDKTKLVSLGDSFYWEGEEKLLEVIDDSLSSAIEKFDFQKEGDEPKKVIFGLSTDWVKESKITSEKLEILKKISKKLDLFPLGFIVIPEGVVHWLKKVEGIPPTAVLVGLSEKKISVTLVDLGKILGTNLVVRSGSVGADLAEGLSRFERDIAFPARVLIYDGEENLEEVRQQLINYPWQDQKVSFLHLPKVEILSADFDIKAIVLASASQMADVKDVELLGEKKDIKEEKGEEEVLETEEVKGDEEEIHKTEQEEVKEISKEDKEGLTQVFGFIKGKDIKEERIEPQPPESVYKEPIPQESPLETEEKKPFQIKMPKVQLGWFKRFDFSSLFSSFKSLLGNKSGLVLTLSVGVLVIIFITLSFLYWYLPKASIILFVEPQTLEKEFLISLDISLSSPNKEKSLLPAQEIETTVIGSKTKETTGTKLIGEKSKGEVTIYNNTSQTRTFDQGTEIYGPSDLVFTLDEDVSVAAESTQSGELYGIPGKSIVLVTAEEFGSEGNLASGSEFSIANYARSDFIASNDSSFSGGTSREIQAISEDDQDGLLAELKEELKQKGLSQLHNELGVQDKLVEESVELKISEEDYSGKVGQESNQISLDLELKIIALTFNEEDFEELIKEEIMSSVPSDFDYNSSQTQTSFELEDVEDDVYTFEAQFKADLTPKFDLEAIKNNLVGKKPAIGKTYLNNLPNVESFEVKITPRLPDRLATFPRVEKKINIEVELR